MRGIKFRAFKYGNWWHSDDEAYILKEYDGILYLCEDVKFYRNTKEYTLEIIGVACQYTGLKDKNGVEIYEGDVLKLSRCDENRIYFDLFYGVTWDAPSFFIHTLHDLCNKGRKRAVKEKRISEAGSAIYYNGGLDIYSSRNLAVIGNIYENPKLLEEKE